MKKLLCMSLIIINAWIFSMLPVFASEELDLGDYPVNNISANYGSFNFVVGAGLGIGMPAGDLLETEKDLLKANNEEFDGINFFHSFNFNLQAESIIRILKISDINFLAGVRGILGYYTIVHKLNGDKDDYDADDYNDEDYVKELLSFGQLMAGPTLYVGSDSGFFGSVYFVYGNVVGGRLTTQPLLQGQPGVNSEKSDFKGKRLDVGFGFSMINNNLFAGLSLVISIIDIELDNKPVIYNDRFDGSNTTITDLSLAFAIGLRIF